jgi:hypothetical protein
MRTATLAVCALLLATSPSHAEGADNEITGFAILGTLFALPNLALPIYDLFRWDRGASRGMAAVELTVGTLEASLFLWHTAQTRDPDARTIGIVHIAIGGALVAHAVWSLVWAAPPPVEPTVVGSGGVGIGYTTRF